MRKRRESKSGEYLHKTALFKVFVGKKVFKFPFHAPANQAYSEENILSLEERVINYIDEKLPRLEFRRVQVGPNAVNFIACGTKPPQGEKSEQVRIGEHEGSGSIGMQEAGASARDVGSSVVSEFHDDDADAGKQYSDDKSDAAS